MHVLSRREVQQLDRNLPAQTRKEDPAVLSDHARRMIAALGG